MDKSWMKLKDRVSDEYRVGVNAFIEFASSSVGLDGKIRCPCVNCMNISYIDINIVKYHLFLRGMSPTYTTWLHHGEEVAASLSNLQNDVMDDDGNESEHNDELEEHGDEILDMLEDIYFGNLRNDDDTERSLDGIAVGDVQNFDKLLHEARRELYPGCKEYNVLSFVITIMHAKVMFKWSNKSVDFLLKILKKLLPNCNEKVPWTVYEAKKLLRDLGLGYECIDACKFDRALFWKENASLDKCPVCKTSRYKSQAKNEKKIPHKVLRYFPVTPRLKRLYMSKKTATDMRWHKEKRVDDRILRHPADGDEWKNFDIIHPEFAREPRNVRLGLATDGFNPFGHMSNSYSTWPIVLTPYNFPPWKCMKEQFFMMSLLIPGPSAPSRNIDVYMRPLIDELKDLWENGVCTYDASSGCTFQMRAAVMWTINDFPAYGNLSGWVTKGYMACPNCNEEHSTQSLRGKIGYMGARRFLPKDHCWRRSKLFDGKVENRPRPQVLTGEQIFEQILAGTYEPYGKHPNNLKRQKLMSKSQVATSKKFNLNWNKKSILFELPYWKTLNLRHNLDVMHIEKNICDNSSVRSRSRGPTKGKSVQRELSKNKGNKLEVGVCPVASTFIGKNATKIANQLGVHIRLSAPLQGVNAWNEIDRGSKDVIIQNVLQMFDIKDFSEQYVQDAIDKRCYYIYKDWRFKWKQHYLDVLKDGKDPYSNAPDPARQEDWRYMIDVVWSSEKHKKRAVQAKINRAQLPYNHTAGSQSFPAKLSLQTEKLGDQSLPFSMFYKDTHWSKKKNDYIHPKCRENYDEIVRRETETVESGDPSYTPEQLSQMVLGERSGYLLGFGKGPKPSSMTRSTSSKATQQEIEKLKAQIEEQNALIAEQNERMQRYEDDRRKYEEDRMAREVETQNQFQQLFAMMRDKFGGDGSGGTSA